ncbi:lysylphosphatidylglycerol synthase transmembrane domain-containing protein [Actinophytocola sp.]|uniref:lysylphosphatidylglycerol synthase transmembrane domain-containing protein n=1 Tax=Actinophytocola sp. TaxID=1872138 RepID=UPI003D6C1ACD
MRGMTLRDPADRELVEGERTGEVLLPITIEPATAERTAASSAASTAEEPTGPASVPVKRRLNKAKVWAWIKILVGVGIVVALVWKVGAAGFIESFRVIDAGEILAALVIGLATTVLSAWRWCLVAHRLGLRLPLGRAVADYYRALFLNAVLPAGVLGDVHRAVRHGRESGDVGAGVRAVVLERTAGQAVVVVAGVVVLLAGPTVAPTRDIGLAVLIVASLFVFGYLALRRWTGPDSRWRRTLDDVRHGLLARDAWPAVAVLSAAVLAGHVTMFVIAAHAAGADLPAAELVPLVIVSLLAMGLPVNVGGWGPREGATVLMFAAAGLGAAQGLTTAVVYGLLGLVASLPGALMLLRPGRGLGQERRQEVTA